MHEPINSVVVGDPASFSVEHAEQEPAVVIVKPITLKPAQTNLLISTVRGHQASLLLISRGDVSEDRPKVDFVVAYTPAGRFIVDPASYPASLVAQTATVPVADVAAESIPTAPRQGLQPRVQREAGSGPSSATSELGLLLDRQRRAPLPKLYGPKPDLSEPGKELVRTGVSEVIDQGQDVVVLFSIVNPQRHPIELMPPQVQLGGKVTSGKLFKRKRWGTSEQLAVGEYVLSRRRLGPGERGDGVVVFTRPPYKQANESLFLQIAESGAVDRPALAPIGFGISSFDFTRETPNGKRAGE
jgi:hypothetical protein